MVYGRYYISSTRMAAPAEPGGAQRRICADDDAEMLRLTKGTPTLLPLLLSDTVVPLACGVRV